jgi:3-hydroxyisobutyrate dehydrogenase-like beta-hydroxyacid dehydrogenase
VRIAFIGFGEAARAFRASLAEAEPGLAFAAYDVLFASEGPEGPCAGAARAVGVEVARDHAGAAAGADWVVSAVTAGSSLAAAEAVAAGLVGDQAFLDINSVSPGRKRATAALMPPGVAYVDMAVMAPVHPRGHRTPALVAGALEPGLVAGLGRLGFRFEVAGPEVGAAAAVKLVRSLFVKGLEAITVEALLAAEATGSVDRVVRSLAGSFPGLGWPGFASYQLERTLTHGTRRAEEMRESAAMLDELGLEAGLARAIAAVQGRVGGLGAGTDTPRFAALLAATAAAVEEGGEGG